MMNTTSIPWLSSTFVNSPMARHLVISVLAAFVLIVPSLVCGAESASLAPLQQLPHAVPEGASLERLTAPAGGLSLFYLMQSPDPARIGVADKEGKILWQKIAGFRPLVEYFWSQDGTKILYVTDCIQPEAELRAGNDRTRSWFIVLDAATGNSLAEGDLDTDLLDLPKDCPDAVGASHMLEVVFGGEKIEVTIDHQGKKVSGAKALSDLISKKQ